MPKGAVVSILPSDRQAILELFLDAAHVAGDMALSYFRLGAPTAARVDYKAGGSPVTEGGPVGRPLPPRSSLRRSP